MSTAVPRSPLEVATAYYDWVWTGKDVERIRTLCADPVLRHDPGGDVTLSHDEQIRRIHAALAKRLQYAFALKIENGEYATLAWQAVSANSNTLLAGIQVMRVVDGRITEVWNAMRPDLWMPQQPVN